MACSRLKFTTKRALTVVKWIAYMPVRFTAQKRISYSGFVSGAISLWKVPSYLIHVHKMFDQEYRTGILLTKCDNFVFRGKQI